MQKLLLSLSAIMLIASTFVLFSFSSNKNKSKSKPLAQTTYYYVTGTSNQRLQPGHLSDLPTTRRSINQSLFTNVNKWSTTVVSYIPTTSTTEGYIGLISFNEEQDADGGSDGQLTLQEALDAVWSAYVSNNPVQMPFGIQVGSANIDIQWATAIH